MPRRLARATVDRVERRDLKPMEVTFLAQPFDHTRCLVRIGDRLAQLLSCRTPLYDRVWLVSAFVDCQVIGRFAAAIGASRRAGAEIHFVVGIDLQGTTVEALREILSLGVDAKVVKNRRPGHTFHPKLYLFEASGQEAVLLVGSSNLTDGGIYKNYEAALSVRYDLTGRDNVEYDSLRGSLDIFLEPSGPTVQVLSENLIQLLLERKEITTESERLASRKRSTAGPRRRRRSGVAAESPFAGEDVPAAPPMPVGLTRRVVRAAKSRRGDRRPGGTYAISEFYMEINPLQRAKIPGEVRIPIQGRDIDPDFWGWQGQYKTEYGERGKKRRAYHNWRTVWRIIDADSPDRVFVDEVRIYGYEDRSEFRFYSSRLVSLGADAPDIVRITRCDPGDEAVFQCELARRGSATHSGWKQYCTQTMVGGKRKFGIL